MLQSVGVCGSKRIENVLCDDPGASPEYGIPMLVRGLILMTGLVWALLGLWCFVRPTVLATLGIVSMNVTSDIELRAVYGGMQIGLGLLLMGGAWIPRWRYAALLATSLVIGATFLGRLAATLLAGESTPYISAALAVEGGVSLLALLALAYESRPSAATAEGVIGK